MIAAIRRLWLSMSLVGMLAVSCGGGGLTQPSAPAIDVSGTWVGSTADANGPRQLRFDLTQIGTNATGFFHIQRPGDVLPYLGTVSGSLSGSTFTFTWMLSGLCSVFGPNCDLVASGTATVSGGSMNGSYTCSANCTDLITTGTVSLARQ